MTGRILGIARREVSGAPMDLCKNGLITLSEGLFGDCKGRKFPERQITILAIEDWQAALLDLAGPAGPPEIDWTVRRANILVEGIRLPRGIGSIIALHEAMLKVTGQNSGCEKMERAYPGMRSALAPNWRGGVTCKVLAGGTIALDDQVKVLVEQPERTIKLPA